MTKDKTLEDILHKLSGMSECHIEFREAKAEIIALVPKKCGLVCHCVKRLNCPHDLRDQVIDATLEAFGAGHD